jgi:hypothetical protein
MPGSGFDHLYHPVRPLEQGPVAVLKDGLICTIRVRPVMLQDQLVV